MKTEEKLRLIELLRRAVYELTGNYYPDERMKILEYKLERLLKNMHTEKKDPEQVVNFFLQTPERKKILIDLMTVPETRFFREREQLEVLLDSLLKEKKFLNVASVGCSTGQEPYSLAMMMEERGIGGKIIGMDINVEVLKKAREGVYKKGELKDIPEKYRKYVTEERDLLKIVPEIKRRVEFKEVNLIERKDFEQFKNSFDLILCRNVLIYFDRRSKEVALENLRSALRKDGILVLSSTEILGKEFYHLFEPLRGGKFVFYRRRG